MHSIARESTRALLAVSTSSDGGKTWSAQTVLTETRFVRPDHVQALALADGRIAVTWKELDSEKLFVGVSRDDGKTWSTMRIDDPEEAPAGPFEPGKLGSLHPALGRNGHLYLGWSVRRAGVSVFDAATVTIDPPLTCRPPPTVSAKERRCGVEAASRAPRQNEAALRGRAGQALVGRVSRV
jgi:hypothetical protein